MEINNERIYEISQYLAEDKEKTNRLLALPAEEAVKEINADDYDFSVDELIAFAEAFDKVAKTGELDEDDLDAVSGGCDPVTLASLLVLCTIVYVAATAAEIWLKSKYRRRR